MQDADNDNGAEQRRRLSPAAERALKEAEERRKQQADLQLPPETGGAAAPNRFVSATTK